MTRADDPEPVTPEPPREPGRTVFSQAWRQVAFVHWAVDPARLAPLLPAGARPDQLGGGTYIGLIVTARIGWRDAALAVIVILALMRTAFVALWPTIPTTTL